MISFGITEEIQKSLGTTANTNKADFMKDFMLFINTNMHLIIAATIPFLALGTKWLFRSAHYNFAEHMVLQSFCLWSSSIYWHLNASLTILHE